MGGRTKIMSEVIGASDVGLGSLTEVTGRESLMRRFADLHELATVDAVGRVLSTKDWINTVIARFPRLEADARGNLKRRIYGLTKSQGGNRPKLWETYPELRGANRIRYNRGIRSALFGGSVVEVVNDPESIVKTKVKDGIFLLPGVVFRTKIIVMGIEGVTLPEGGVLMGVAMGRAVSVFVYEDKQRGERKPFLKPVMCGGVERAWSSEAEKVLGVEGKLGESVRQSADTALKVAARNMAHPYPGGLPGLGRKS